MLNLREVARVALSEWLGQALEEQMYEALKPKVVRFEVVYETPDGLLKTNWYENGEDRPRASTGRVLQRS